MLADIPAPEVAPGANAREAGHVVQIERASKAGAPTRDVPRAG